MCDVYAGDSPVVACSGLGDLMPRCRPTSPPALALVFALVTGCGGDPAAAPSVGPPSAQNDARADALPPSDGPPPAPVDEMLQRLWHVDAAATARDADGSRDRPYPTLVEAFRVARSGDIVLLAAGDHEKSGAAVPAGLEVQGSGAESTRLSGPLRLTGAGSSVRNLTIVGGAPGLLVDGPDTTVDQVTVTDSTAEGVRVQTGPAVLSRLTIRRATGGGLRFIDAHATVSRILIEGVAPEADGLRGHGFEVEGGEVSGDDLVVREAADRSVRLVFGAKVTLNNVHVPPGAFDGISVLSEAVATLSNVRVEGARGVAVTVLDASATLRDVSITHAGREGLFVTDATLDAERVSVLDSTGRAVSLLRAEGELRAIDVRRAGNVAVQITDNRGPLTLLGGDVVDNGMTGIGVFGDSTGPILLKDLRISGTRAAGGDYAEGIHLYRAYATIEGVESARNEGAGLLIEEARATVSGCTFEENGDPGVVVVSSREAVTFTGNTARANRGAGFLLVDAVADFDGNTATAQRPSLDDQSAHGISLIADARAHLRADQINGNPGSGLFLFGRSHAEVVSGTYSENGEYGIKQSCDGSEVVLGLSVELGGNTLGPRNGCN